MTIMMVKYLTLEAEMFRLEKAGESADAMRDQMDPLWHAMSEVEREELDRRIVGQEITETAHLSADGVFVT